MPKVGMEPIRKRALMEAAIGAIHASGSINVTISDIASRAGVSQGLAHHYFGSKEDLLLATMRHVLTEFGIQVRDQLKTARTPHQRVQAIIAASLGRSQFAPETVSVWLVFYVYAQASEPARNLLTVYSRRLHSNLVHSLRVLCGEESVRIASAIAAMIDGIYIRRGLAISSPEDEEAIAMVQDYANLLIEGANSARQ